MATAHKTLRPPARPRISAVLEPAATLPDGEPVCEALLEAIAGVEGLRGPALEWADIVGLAGTLAEALGLRVIDEDA